MISSEKKIHLHFIADLYYSSDKILTIKFSPGSMIDLAAAKQVVNNAQKLTNNEPHANIIDIREMTFMDNEARNYFSKQNQSYIIAIAVLSTSSIHSKLINLYFRYAKPKLLTKYFNNEEKAKNWLRCKLEEQKTD